MTQSNGSVCGTPVFAADDEDRPVIMLVADLHVPPDGGQVLEDLRTLLRQAQEYGEQLRLCIMGDLFDAFVGPKQAQVGVWAELVTDLRRTTDAGVSISVLHGNRDYMLGEPFARATGCRVVPGGLRTRVGGIDTLLLHGDELCLNDLPYQKSKRWLRSWGMRLLGRRLPLSISLKIAAKIRAKSLASTSSGDQERFHPVQRALREVFASGVERLVFGHIHRPSRTQLAGLGEVLVLPAFDETGIFLAATDSELFYRDLAGARLPDFAARTFPE